MSSSYETLTCGYCYHQWTRRVVRGRKPRYCATCVRWQSPVPVRRPRAVSKALEINDGGKADAGYGGEASDCTVRALATATGRSYLEAHAFMAANGRRKGRGAPFTSVLSSNGNKALGHTFVPTYVVKSRGLRALLERNPQLRTGTWILHMTRHVATLRDGRLLDSFDSSRKDIRSAWRVL